MNEIKKYREGKRINLHEATWVRPAVATRRRDELVSCYCVATLGQTTDWATGAYIFSVVFLLAWLRLQNTVASIPYLLPSHSHGAEVRRAGLGTGNHIAARHQGMDGVRHALHSQKI